MGIIQRSARSIRISELTRGRKRALLGGGIEGLPFPSKDENLWRSSLNLSTIFWILERTDRDFSVAGIFVIRVSMRSSHCFSKLKRRCSSGISTVWTRTSNSSPTWIWSASIRMDFNFSRRAAAATGNAAPAATPPAAEATESIV